MVNCEGENGEVERDGDDCAVQCQGRMEKKSNTTSFHCVF